MTVYIPVWLTHLFNQSKSQIKVLISSPSMLSSKHSSIIFLWQRHGHSSIKSLHRGKQNKCDKHRFPCLSSPFPLPFPWSFGGKDCIRFVLKTKKTHSTRTTRTSVSLDQGSTAQHKWRPAAALKKRIHITSLRKWGTDCCYTLTLQQNVLRSSGFPTEHPTPCARQSTGVHEENIWTSLYF